MEPFTASERLRAIKPVLEQTVTVTAAAQQIGVSRKTLHGWMRRYHEGGLAALADRPSTPGTTPHAVPADQVAEIIALRGQHPTWGPKKLKAWLEREYPRVQWPVVSTMGDLLRRRGLVKKRKRRHGRSAEPRATFQPATKPNDTWCMDFKGHFRLGRGPRCHPLTVQDLVSRYLLVSEGLHAERDALVWPVLERAFREYGLPKTVRHDNGSPFASTGAGGLSRLSVRFIRLGIIVERTDVSSPAQNGRLERMHRVMKAEVASPPQSTMKEQQRVLDQFRREYNEDRPHEAIGQVVPASLYQASTRLYTGILPEPTYPGDFVVRRVYPAGFLKWQGVGVFVSGPLGGELVGVRPIGGGLHEMYFGPVFLGVLDEVRPEAGLIHHRPE